MIDFIFLTKNFPPDICGVGDYTFELTSRLEKQKIVSGIITKSGYRISSAHTSDRFVFPIVKRMSLNYVLGLIDVLKKNQATWLFIQYVPYSFSKQGVPFYMIILVLLSRLKGIKIGIFFHEVSVRVFGYGMKSFVLGVLQRSLAYVMMIFSNQAATSNVLYRSYFYPFRVSLVPIPANIYAPLGTRIVKEPWNAYCFLMVTFMNRCTLQILEAFKGVLQRVAGARLMIVGKGSIESRSRIEYYSQHLGIFKSVEFFDKFAKEDVANAMSSADLFLHDEEVNTLGHGGVCSKSGVIAAAMAAGLPIISTRGDMTDDQLFIHQFNMILLERRTSLEYEKAMMGLYEKADVRKMLGKNAKSTYDKYFSWENTLLFYLNAISST